ncbi:MAG: hypothetical protein GQ535_03585 [Rhodobacteraceae bacterium]|nr:hypothetical protein [Paracoccaceae bacterium]
MNASFQNMNNSGVSFEFFPLLTHPGATAVHVRRLITVSWLMMGEGFPIIEDVEGASNDPDLLRRLRLLLGDLLAQLDAELGSGVEVISDHRLAVAAEYGLSRVADWDGPSFVAALQLEKVTAQAGDITYLQELWRVILEAYPITLINPLNPESQSGVLKALRNWSKLCDAAGIDSAFLASMMKDV